MDNQTKKRNWESLTWIFTGLAVSSFLLYAYFHTFIFADGLFLLMTSITALVGMFAAIRAAKDVLGWRRKLLQLIPFLISLIVFVWNGIAMLFFLGGWV